MNAINASATVILGPACTSDMIAVAYLTTFYNIGLVTGAGNLMDSTDLWPYVTRPSYNTFTQWTFFKIICDRFRWRNIFVLSEEDPLNTFNKLSADGIVRLILETAVYSVHDHDST